MSKSKLISTAPDYFVCPLNNSANRLREILSPAITGSTGNYGWLSLYLPVSNSLPAYTTLVNFEMIFFCWIKLILIIIEIDKNREWIREI